VTPDASRPRAKWDCGCDVADAIDNLNHETDLALIGDVGWQTRLAGNIDHFLTKVRDAAVSA
jgi:hypothetical protein